MAWSILRSFGDALFLIASFLTACYTVIIRQSKLDPIHVAALVSRGSLVIYAPIYAVLHGSHLAGVPLTELTVQVIFQGIAVNDHLAGPLWACGANPGGFRWFGFWRIVTCTVGD